MNPTVAAAVGFTAGLLWASTATRHLLADWKPAWAQRGIMLPGPAWLFAVTAAGGGALAGWVWGAACAPVGALVGWLAAVAVSTDLASQMIPREACIIVFTVGWLIAAGAGVAGLCSAAVALLLACGVMLLIALATRGGLGSGDIRLLAAITPLAAWAGYTGVVTGLAVASLLQAVALVSVYRGRNARPFAPALIAGIVLANAWAYWAGITPATEWAGLLA